MSEQRQPITIYPPCPWAFFQLGSRWYTPYARFNDRQTVVDVLGLECNHAGERTASIDFAWPIDAAIEYGRRTGRHANEDWFGWIYDDAASLCGRLLTWAEVHARAKNLYDNARSAIQAVP